MVQCRTEEEFKVFQEKSESQNHLRMESEKTPLQQWESRLSNAQVATYILVEDLKGKLELCLRIGNNRWSEMYNCLGALDSVGEVVKGTGGKWKASPVRVIQELVCRIQAFRDPILSPYIDHLRRLEQDFAALLETSVC
jgi:hypothetical protein